MYIYINNLFKMYRFYVYSKYLTINFTFILTEEIILFYILLFLSNILLCSLHLKNF